MAYQKDDLIKQSLEIIKEKEVIFLDELISYLPCSSATFYNHKLEKVEDIKDAIELNKVNQKASLRKQWHKSTIGILQLSLYKLLATEDELRRLSGHDNDHETKDQTVDFEYEILG